MINTSPTVWQTIKSFAANGLAIAAIATSSVVVATSIPSPAQASTAFNCVLYAKSQVPSLPNGLWTLADKRRIINSSQPTPGAVAIIDNRVSNPVIRNYGHVAVVRDVYGNGTIRIQESNWGGCGIRYRTGTPANLGILGYFRPR